jgi:signal transduction histidine kinase
MESRHVERAIIIAFAAVVLSFVSATWFSEQRSDKLERAALSIHSNAAPSIRRLATASAELRRLQLLVHRALEREPGPSNAFEISAGRELLNEQLSAYQALPYYPGEDAAWLRAKAALNRLDDQLTRIVAALGQGDPRLARGLQGGLDLASDELARALSQDIEFNAAAATRLASDIQTSRRQGILWAAVLDLLGVILAVAAAAWSLRIARAYARAERACSDMAERRAEELDQFAGRMAHDVRTPLSVVGMSLAMAERYGGDDPRFRRALRRATMSFQQTRGIIDALFEFARSGARPDPSARASISDAAEGVAVNVCTRAEEVGAEIIVRAGARSLVACSPGLVESAIGNLVNNAITYVEGRDKRVVAIETADDGPAVKVRVSDTGPGLPEGSDPAILFEPHIRGANARGRGLGLGLATVKKVVEAHGGQVGVESSPDGCVFWFTLPAAAPTISPTVS